MKIIHFSDIHAGMPPESWRVYLDKRCVGIANYRMKRRFQHDFELLKKAVDFILDFKPDLAVCTGDLTTCSQPSEFAKALEGLAPLSESDIPLLYVPGNHDCYVKSKECFDAMKNAFQTLNGESFSFEDMPIVKRIGSCDFIIINTVRPTNIFSSCGYMTRKTSDFILETCSDENKTPKILVGHYPIIEEHPVSRFRHRLWGQKKVAGLLKNGKLDLSLCGHRHMPYSKLDQTGRGEICAGSITKNSCLSIIEYIAEENIFSHESRIM